MTFDTAIQAETFRLGCERLYGASPSLTLELGSPEGDTSIEVVAAHGVPLASHDAGAYLRDALGAARRLLYAAATGEAVPAKAITDLIDAVLGTPVVRLALGAREAGPHRLMLALRLAAAVCEAGAAHEALKASGKGA